MRMQRHKNRDTLTSSVLNDKLVSFFSNCCMNLFCLRKLSQGRGDRSESQALLLLFKMVSRCRRSDLQLVLLPRETLKLHLDF